MCDRCNYTDFLKSSGLGYTRNRLRVLKAIGDNHRPLSAQEIFDTLKRSQPINRVTVYRVLDRLVDAGLVDRISSGGRAFFFGLSPNENHHPHPHFYCKRCGQMECLSPSSLPLDIDALNKIHPGKVHNVEVRLDGICKKCLKMA